MPAILARIPALADMWGWGHHSWWAGGLMMLLWLLVVVALVVVLARSFDRRDRAPAASDAEQVLAARFARGEIDETEFRARLAVLRERR